MMMMLMMMMIIVVVIIIIITIIIITIIIIDCLFVHQVLMHRRGSAVNDTLLINVYKNGYRTNLFQNSNKFIKRHIQFSYILTFMFLPLSDSEINNNWTIISYHCIRFNLVPFDG